MKKFFPILFVILMISFRGSYAQNVAVGIDGYSTNAWFALIVPGIHYAYSIHVDKEVPQGYNIGRMYSPYRRTFSNPFHRFGDLTAGLSASFDFEGKPYGFYGALRYKTSEAHYQHLPKGHDNDRVHYIQPEIGIRAYCFNLGVAYDAVLGYKGHVHDYDKDAVNSGFNFVVGITDKGEKGNFSLKYIHPLYNFYNKRFSPDGGLTHPLDGLNYKIGYITASYRIFIDD